METRLYGLFERGADGKWVRLYPTMAFKKSSAVRIFQGALLDGAMGHGPERCLKVVKPTQLGMPEVPTH